MNTYAKGQEPPSHAHRHLLWSPRVMRQGSWPCPGRTRTGTCRPCTGGTVPARKAPRYRTQRCMEHVSRHASHGEQQRDAPERHGDAPAEVREHVERRLPEPHAVCGGGSTRRSRGQLVQWLLWAWWTYIPIRPVRRRASRGLRVGSGEQGVEDRASGYIPHSCMITSFTTSCPLRVCCRTGGTCQHTQRSQ